MARSVVPVLDRFADDCGQDSDPSYPVRAPVVAMATVLALGCSTRAWVTQSLLKTVRPRGILRAQVVLGTNKSCCRSRESGDPVDTELSVLISTSQKIFAPGIL